MTTAPRSRPGKLLGPPKGVEDARAAVLAGRFGEPVDTDQARGDEQEAAAEAAAWLAQQEAPVVVPEPPAAPVKTSRNPAPGMVRQTFYMAVSTVEVLEAAVDSVRAQLGPLGSRVATHEILAAIVAAGVADPKRVATGLRKQLLGG